MLIVSGRDSERKSQKNKDYGIRAIELLKRNPKLAVDKNLLWKTVIDRKVKKHNSQMDVVIALWENGLIK
ncbi:DUF6979 family protein [Paenibacillus periandrae]|uniref:DUF6979 family protein n=1 Tax=Paenibacillus periandrae TaxID=1761741 RepID=UPI003B831DE3